ncbi:MAG: thioredoxin domain-containing protein [Verrucomicrobia bacterium]|nr:thioredoxin domain-containing protein [Verrucomicrobiota bacterium]
MALTGLPGCQHQAEPRTPSPSSSRQPDVTTHLSTNRLAQEKSPYLLQHQHNPVDWFPWGEEAFAKARAENKPVFLSIGYSTCHWCHVMERESFEDPAVAQFLNRHFVSIKVDREERPDVDRIYMTFVQAMTGSGGWPLNVFLLPDRRPFYGGTYFPPRTRPGRPGFRDLLEQLAQVWKEREGDVARSAAEIHERLAAHVAREPLTGLALGPVLLANAATRLKAEYDPQHGGFGAPQVPRPSHPRLPPPLVPARRRRGSPPHGAAHVRTHGRRRHVRSTRRRLRALLRGRSVVGPALREDALRQRPARAALSRRLPREPRRPPCRHRSRHHPVRLARPDPS